MAASNPGAGVISLNNVAASVGPVLGFGARSRFCAAAGRGRRQRRQAKAAWRGNSLLMNGGPTARVWRLFNLRWRLDILVVGPGSPPLSETLLETWSIRKYGLRGERRPSGLAPAG